MCSHKLRREAVLKLHSAESTNRIRLEKTAAAVIAHRISKLPVIALVFLLQNAASAADVPVSLVLERARDAVIELRCVHFSFRVSDHGNSLMEFWSDASKTKVTAPVPALRRDNSVVTDNVVYAYNGEIFQQRRTLHPSLAFSRSPLGGDTLRGPCLTPLEQCYAWLRVVRVDYNWNSIRDPQVWADLEPLSLKTFEDGADTIHRVCFRSKAQVNVFVDFSTQYKFFPREYRIGSEEGADSFTAMKASKFIELSGRYLPTAVEADTPPHNGLAGTHAEYEVLPDRVSCECPNDAEFFTLHPEIGDEVLDWDSNIGSIHGSDVKSDLIPEPIESIKLAPQPQHPGRSRKLLIFNGVLLGGSVLWYLLRRRPNWRSVSGR